MCNEKLGTEDKCNDNFVAITSDLHTLPMVFATGETLEELCEQISMFAFELEISEDSWLVIQNAVQLAEPPNDGLLGTMLTKPLILPELGGIVFHIQFA